MSKYKFKQGRNEYVVLDFEITAIIQFLTPFVVYKQEVGDHICWERN